jgi:hypothetical protein
VEAISKLVGWCGWNTREYEMNRTEVLLSWGKMETKETEIKERSNFHMG